MHLLYPREAEVRYHHVGYQTNGLKLLNIDVKNSESLKIFSDFGFGAEDALKGIKQSAKCEFLERTYINFLTKILLKLKERSPATLSSRLLCQQTFPNLIRTSPSLASNRISDLLHELMAVRHMRLTKKQAIKRKSNFTF